MLLRASKYLNNLVEQDHLRIGQCRRSMLGSKMPSGQPLLIRSRFRTAVVVIGGIELAEKIKKGQLKIGKLGGSTTTMPEIRQATLAA